MIASYPRLRRTRAAWLPMYPAPPTTRTAKALSCTTQDIIIEALWFESILAMAGINSRTMDGRQEYAEKKALGDLPYRSMPWPEGRCPISALCEPNVGQHTGLCPGGSSN